MKFLISLLALALLAAVCYASDPVVIPQAPYSLAYPAAGGCANGSCNTGSSYSTRYPAQYAYQAQAQYVTSSQGCTAPAAAASGGLFKRFKSRLKGCR